MYILAQHPCELISTPSRWNWQRYVTETGIQVDSGTVPSAFTFSLSPGLFTPILYRTLALLPTTSRSHFCNPARFFIPAYLYTALPTDTETSLREWYIPLGTPMNSIYQPGAMASCQPHRRSPFS